MGYQASTHSEEVDSSTPLHCGELLTFGLFEPLAESSIESGLPRRE